MTCSHKGRGVLLYDEFARAYLEYEIAGRPSFTYGNTCSGLAPEDMLRSSTNVVASLSSLKRKTLRDSMVEWVSDLEEVIIHYEPYHLSTIHALVMRGEIGKVYPHINAIYSSPDVLSLEPTPMNMEYLALKRLNNRMYRDMTPILGAKLSRDLGLGAVALLDSIDRHGLYKADPTQAWILAAMQHVMPDHSLQSFLVMMKDFYRRGLATAPGVLPWRLVATRATVAHGRTRMERVVDDILTWQENNPSFNLPEDNWHLAAVNTALANEVPGGIPEADAARRQVLLMEAVDSTGGITAVGKFLLGIFRKHCPELMDRRITTSDKLAAWVVARKNIIRAAKNSMIVSSVDCYRCGRKMKEAESEFGPYYRCVCSATKVKARELAINCPDCLKNGEKRPLLLQTGPGQTEFLRCASYPSCAFSAGLDYLVGEASVLSA